MPRRPPRTTACRRCEDGVHALGVEPFHVDALGCDFFVAGTHEWLSGPRGMGIV
jgi:isopenicillin-N epimerase